MGGTRCKSPAAPWGRLRPGPRTPPPGEGSAPAVTVTLSVARCTVARVSTRRALARIATVVAALGLLAGGCGGGGGGSSGATLGPERGSLEDFTNRAAHDPGGQALVRYFNYDRYRSAAEIPDDLSDAEAVLKVFLEGGAANTLAPPFRDALSQGRPDDTVVPFTQLTSSYIDEAVGAGILFGDYDVEGIGATLEAGATQVEVREEGTRTLFQVGVDDGVGDDPTDISVLYGGRTVSVDSEGGPVVVSATVDGQEALAHEGLEPVVVLEGIKELAQVVDRANAYAATISLGGGEGGEGGRGGGGLVAPWARGVAATALDDEGEPVAITALWHDTTEHAAANADALVALMEQRAQCVDEVELTEGDLLLVAQCSSNARWATTAFDSALIS